MLGVDEVKLAHNMRKLQKEGEKIQRSVFETVEKGNVKIVVRGDKSVESIEIDGKERKDLKDMLNDAFKKVEKRAEKKMKSQAGAMMELMKGGN